MCIQSNQEDKKHFVSPFTPSTFSGRVLALGWPKMTYQRHQNSRIRLLLTLGMPCIASMVLMAINNEESSCLHVCKSLPHRKHASMGHWHQGMAHCVLR